MSSQSAKFRQRLKETDPAKYAEMLAKDKERSKRNREARKKRWESEPQTRAVIQDKETFIQKQRLRWRRFYEKKKPRVKTRHGKSLADTRILPEAGKPPKDMTPAEFIEHKRQQRRTSRMNETPMKAAWRRKKDREYQRKKRAEKRASVPSTPATSSLQVSIVCSPVKKQEYNLISRLRKHLASKAKTPGKFAHLLKNMATHTRSPRKRAALMGVGLIQKSISAARKKLFKARKERADALPHEHVNTVKIFF